MIKDKWLPMSFERKPYKKQWSKKDSAYPKKSKRGLLKPLLSEEVKQAANIQDLSMDFASRSIRLYQYLNEDAEYKEYVLSKQVLRSGTSIGANVRELTPSRTQ